MKTYIIPINRVSRSEERNIVVKAKSKKEAEALAIEQAMTEDWQMDKWYDYEIDGKLQTIYK